MMLEYGLSLWYIDLHFDSICLIISVPLDNSLFNSPNLYMCPFVRLSSKMTFYCSSLDPTHPSSLVLCFDGFLMYVFPWWRWGHHFRLRVVFFWPGPVLNISCQCRSFIIPYILINLVNGHYQLRVHLNKIWLYMMDSSYGQYKTWTKATHRIWEVMDESEGSQKEGKHFWLGVSKKKFRWPVTNEFFIMICWSHGDNIILTSC